MITPEKSSQILVPGNFSKTSLDAITIKDYGNDNTSDFKSPKRPHARSLSKKLAQKAKQTFSLPLDRDDDEDIFQSYDTQVSTAGKRPTLESKVSHDPAFNPAHIRSHRSPPSRKPHMSVKDDIKSVASVVAHPKDSIKERATRTAAGKISKVSRPFLSPEEDREFLAKHEDLSRAASSRSSGAYNSESEQNHQEEVLRTQLEELEDHRSSLKAAWSIGRHVDRVRVVRTKVPRFPDKGTFEEKDEAGNFIRLQWEKYIGYVALYYTRGFTSQYIDEFDQVQYDLDLLARTVERLSMVSQPWQAWWVSSRSLYRWEDPLRTARWFALYVYIWYTDHVVGFFYAYVIYITLKQRFFPSSVDDVRESLDRALDHTAQARAWGEFVDQHGRKDWVDPLMEQIGPQIVLQLVSTPGNHYPKYRFLLDPFMWILWDIPTNAEWAVRYLQAKAVKHESDYENIQSTGADRLRNSKRLSLPSALRRQSKSVKKVPAKSFGSQDLSVDSSDGELLTPPSSPRMSPQLVKSEVCFTFHVACDGVSGKVAIDQEAIRFFCRRRDTAWTVAYSDLVEMRKVSGNKHSKLAVLRSSPEGIEFSHLQADSKEETVHLDAQEQERDEIFNLIIGWSHLRWRPLRLDRSQTAY
ncbi:MAG: hypothetical protein Q9227_003910 [Pyrenula ochraceoflavens]